MLYHIGMSNGNQAKTVVVRAERLSDAQDAALRANQGFHLTGHVHAQEENPTQEVVDAQGDDGDDDE